MQAGRYLSLAWSGSDNYDGLVCDLFPVTFFLVVVAEHLVLLDNNPVLCQIKGGHTNKQHNNKPNRACKYRMWTELGLQIKS